jgi:hypothetical protein
MRSVWSCTKGSSVDFIWPLWNLLDATPGGAERTGSRA